MKTYNVWVVKMLRVEGVVKVKSASEKAALKAVQKRMSDARNPMQTTEPTWGDPEYVDFTFETLGFAEEA